MSVSQGKTGVEVSIYVLSKLNYLNCLIFILP